MSTADTLNQTERPTTTPTGGAQLVLAQVAGMVRFTVREALHRWTLMAFLLAVTLFLLLLATTVNLDIVEGTLASARLFGQELVLPDVGIEISDVVTTFQVVIITLLYTVGVGLALFSTSNLVPRLCVEGWVDLLLAQPITRPTLLLGRAAGAVTVVTLNVAYLVIGSWVLLRWKTGFGNAGFLLAAAIIVFAYAVCYSGMVLVGVVTRNSPVSILAGLFFWLSGHIFHAFHAYPQWSTSLRAGWPRQTGVLLTESLYWTLPKSQGLAEMAVNAARGESVSWAPLLFSMPFAVGSLTLACIWFARRDY
jgi:ABC-type transport system involved in multi-copper enzyme maturation permease subunit